MKPRVQSRILQLPDEQRREIDAWLLGGRTYKDIRELLLPRFGITVAASSLCNYFNNHLGKIQQTGPLIKSWALTPDGTVTVNIEVRIQVAKEWPPDQNERAL